MNKALLRNITEWIEWEKFWRGKTSRPLAPLVKPYSFPCVALLIIFTQEILIVIPFTTMFT
jgi:hypothetical protein